MNLAVRSTRVLNTIIYDDDRVRRVILNALFEITDGKVELIVFDKKIIANHEKG